MEQDPGPPWARFDDLTPGGRSLELRHPRELLVADRPDQVLPLLRRLEEATGSGLWAAGFLAYEAAAGLELPLPTRPAGPDDPGPEPPLAWFGLFPGCRAAEPLRPRAGADPGYRAGPWRPELGPRQHGELVERLRQLIGQGEMYQCNLTMRLRSELQGDAFELYRDLALAQRGAHAAFVDTGRFALASASPELFFEWVGDTLTTRPMKGTARRGRWAEEDARAAQQLQRSEKERAENVMIVDLLRNDLGKVAAPGTVEVASLFDLERFETVWQLTSTVRARARAGLTLAELLGALFPCGSVTGAPKRRAMAAIAELEPSRRGVYCGAIGLVAPPVSPLRARFSVAIRTVVVDRRGGRAAFGSGGAITWDSEAPGEHAELLAKAAVLGPPRQEFRLLETMGFEPGTGVRNLEDHLRRLASSADYFGFALDLGRLREALAARLSGQPGPARLRLLLGREGDLDLELGPLPASRPGPVRLALDCEPVRSSEPLLFHKTTRRTPYAVRAARFPEADDVILVNERGELTETTIANLALRLDGAWFTPALESGCLPGVERGRMLAQGRLRARPIRVQELARAEELAVLSSLRGWRRAELLEGAPGGAPPPPGTPLRREPVPAPGAVPGPGGTPGSPPG